MLATSKKRNDYQRENTIGRMGRRIMILTPIVSNGSSNEDKVDGYTPIAVKPKVWARVNNDTGDTIVDQNQARHTQKTIFTIRYRTDITIKHKIAHNGKMYTVLSAIELDEFRKSRTRITCEYLADYTYVTADNTYITVDSTLISVDSL